MLNELQVFEVKDARQLQSLTSLIDHIEDKSDFMVQRRRVIFKNGYELSVIYGFGSYGSQNGLFEVAAFDSSGDWALRNLRKK